MQLLYRLVLSEEGASMRVAAGVMLFYEISLQSVKISLDIRQPFDYNNNKLKKNLRSLRKS